MRFNRALFRVSEVGHDELDEILRRTLAESVVLFLGSGASLASGGQSTEALITSIKSNFPKEKFSGLGFIDTCQAVLDTPLYSRRDLEVHIKKALDPLVPSKWHVELTKYPWAGIVTTNFDDLIEQAFRSSKKKHRVFANEQFSLSEANTVPIFKIMGSVNATTREEGQMVLSRTDFHRSIKMRSELLKYIFDFLKSGSILFVGYRGKEDQIAFDTIDELIERFGIDAIQPSFALYPKLESSHQFEYSHSKRKITAVECTFEKLLDFLAENQSSRVVTPPTRTQLRILGFDIPVDNSSASDISQYFHIFQEKDLNEDSGSMDDFFRGVNKSWGAFKAGWDFRREMYSGVNGLGNRVLSELRNNDPRDNKVIVVAGNVSEY